MANEKTGTLQFQQSDGSYVAGYPKTLLSQVIGGQDAIDTAKVEAIETAGTNADAKYPVMDGTGATGTWDVSISGKAATAAKADAATTAEACTGNAATATTAESAKACTGNSATATKLATARTIALSGDATGSASFDGSSNITIPVVFVRTTGLTDLIPDNAGAHNSIYRGNDLTAAFNNGTMSTNIQNGTFHDIFIGDYIDKAMTVSGNSIGTVRWRVADLDYFYMSGDSACTAHHALMVPDDVLDVNIRMNASNDTTGGYLGTEMWKTTLPKYTAAIQSAFGTSHVLGHREWLTNTIAKDAPSAAGAGWTGCSSDAIWTDVTANNMNEQMVHGSACYSSSGFDSGSGNKQLSLFAHLNRYIIAGYRRDSGAGNRKWYWLRAVASSSCFCNASDDGGAYYADAAFQTADRGIRPYFLLR